MEYNFYKPMRVESLCLICHGDKYTMAPNAARIPITDNQQATVRLLIRPPQLAGCGPGQARPRRNQRDNSDPPRGRDRDSGSGISGSRP